MMRSNPYELLSPADVDWARLAALIDGEGSILINKRTGREDVWLRVVICNTDPRMIVWLKETFGGTAIVARKAYRDGYKAQMKWQVNCVQAEWLLRGCYKYLICKQDQADIAFAYRATSRGAGGHRGRPTPPELVAERLALREQLRQLRAVGKSNADLEELRDRLERRVN